MFDITDNLNAILDDDVELLESLTEGYDQTSVSAHLLRFEIHELTLAHLAILNNCPRVLDYLLTKCFSPELEDNDGDTLIMFAAGVENPRADACIDVLLRHHANIHHRNKKGQTPLMVAAYMDNLYAINRLLEKGVNINDRDDLGQSAISCAANSINRRFRGAMLPNRTTIMTLLKAGAQPRDLYESYCILGVRDPYEGLAMIPLRKYSRSLLYRDDLFLMRINPSDTNLVQQLLS